MHELRHPTLRRRLAVAAALAKPDVRKKLADLKKCSEELISNITTQNAISIFEKS